MVLTTRELCQGEILALAKQKRLNAESRHRNVHDAKHSRHAHTPCINVSVGVKPTPNRRTAAPSNSGGKESSAKISECSCDVAVTGDDNMRNEEDQKWGTILPDSHATAYCRDDR